MTYFIEKIKRKNGKTFLPVAEFETEAEVLNYCKENNLSYAGTPYIFVCINLSDGSRIKQKHNGIICSPETLKKTMQEKVKA